MRIGDTVTVRKDYSEKGDGHDLRGEGGKIVALNAPGEWEITVQFSKPFAGTHRGWEEHKQYPTKTIRYFKLRELILTTDSIFGFTEIANDYTYITNLPRPE